MKPKLRFPGFQEEWEAKKLGEVVEVQMCKRIFKEQTTSHGEIPFFKIGTLGKAPDAFISKELFEEYKEKYNYPRIDEVMMTCSGTVGKSFAYNGQQAYYQDSNIIWLHNDTNIITNLFLLYSVKNMTWNTLSSTTIKRIYNKDIYQKKIPFPSIPEQEKLGKFLSKIDERIEKQEEKVELLKERKKGWMQQLFSQSIRFKDENGQDYPAWEEKKLEYIIQYYIKGKKSTEVYKGNVLLTTDFLECGLQTYVKEQNNVQVEDILMLWDGSQAGKVYIGYKGVLGSTFMKLVVNDNVSAIYIYQYLKFKQKIIQNRWRTGSGIPHVSKDFISNFEITLPTFLEQEKIAKFLSKQDELIEKEEEKLSLLKEQKKGLLQQMFV